MSTESLPPETAVDLDGAPYSGRHELARCETCMVSVLRPDSDDLAAVRAGEDPGSYQSWCQCVGGHQLHRCAVCVRLKVIRADADDGDSRAHRVPGHIYVWAITAAAFLLLYLRLADLPAWAWTIALWAAVGAALVAVVRLAGSHHRRDRFD